MGDIKLHSATHVDNR